MARTALFLGAMAVLMLSVMAILPTKTNVFRFTPNDGTRGYRLPQYLILNDGTRGYRLPQYLILNDANGNPGDKKGKAPSTSKQAAPANPLRRLTRTGSPPRSLLESGVERVADAIGDAFGDFMCTAIGVQPRDSSASNEEGPVRYPKFRKGNTVCYQGLGSFNLGFPWDRSFVPEPNTPDYINTQFHLYTRKSSGRTLVTIQPKVDLKATDFQPNRKTFIITHGFLNDGTMPWMGVMKDAILSKVDGNVFLTDWGDGAKDGNYIQTVANCRIVGAEIARLLRHCQELGLSMSNVHLIGHSLGAQISSYAAKATPGLGRITALDPAQPAFENHDLRVRINPSDAQFVDAIHTNAKLFIPLLGFGMMQSVGHVDFYFNGGADQPGCDIPTLESIGSIENPLQTPVSVLAQLVLCSHERAHDYFTEAITSDCKMWGHPVSPLKQFANMTTGGFFEFSTMHGKCEPGACIPVGFDTPEYPARGSFAVKTGPTSPYCIQEYSNDGQDLNELKSLKILPNTSGPARRRLFGNLFPGRQ